MLIECGRKQACRFAGRFLSIDPPDRVDDDVRDVFGELANMVSGNLKCVLKPGIQLSMPSLIDGSDYNLRVCGMEFQDRLSFECSDGLFWVTIMSAPPTAASGC